MDNNKPIRFDTILLLGRVVGLTTAVGSAMVNYYLPRYYSVPYLGIFIDIEFIREIRGYIREEP